MEYQWEEVLARWRQFAAQSGIGEAEAQAAFDQARRMLAAPPASGERQAVYRQGLKLARENGISPGTIAAFARQMGLTPSR